MTDDNLLATLLSIASSARPTLSAECLFSQFPQNQLVEREFIDLTKRLDIVVKVQEFSPESERFVAYDRITFDGDPTSSWCIYGRGKTRQFAIKDLLVRLAERQS